MTRSARYGVFGDLVLYQRSEAEGGPFFLDRFETTRADWWRYVEEAAPTEGSPVGGGEPEASGAFLPVVRVTLAQARRYARWRFCRLPRRDEWDYAATGRGGYAYPWGDLFTPAWVNSAELGLASPTPVGTFESGRGDGGAYDLLGNVAEWTESVDAARFGAVSGDAGGLLPLSAESLDGLSEMPAMLPWRVAGLPWPSYWWIEAWGGELPRLVVGGHFRSLLQRDDMAEAVARRDGLGPMWERGAMERGDTVGVRLASDPADLIRALAQQAAVPTELEESELRAFLRRPPCRAALAPRWREQRAEVAGSPGGLFAILDEELGS